MPKKRVSTVVVQDLIMDAMEHGAAFMDATHGTSNPQVEAMRIATVATINTLEAVLEALRGNSVPLRIMAGK